MFKKEKGMLKMFGLASLSAALLVAGCSDGGSLKPAGQPTTIDPGKVVQGPVMNATVIADKLPSNQIVDEGEISTTTDGSGAFDFGDATIDYADDPGYILVSKGGTDKLTGKTGRTNFAPPGSENITPLTTMVALAAPEDQADVQAALEELTGVAFDADFSDEAGVPPEALKVVKAIEATLDLFDNPVLGVKEAGEEQAPVSVQQAIMKQAAKKLVEAKNAAAGDATITEVLQTALKATTTEVVKGLTGTNISAGEDATAQLESVVEALVKAVEEDVDANVVETVDANGNTIKTVVEANVQEKLNDQSNIAEALDTLKDVVATSVSVAEVTIVDAFDAPVTGTAPLFAQLSSPIQESFETLQATCVVQNTATDPAIYDNESVTLEIKEVGLDRFVRLTVSGLEATIDGTNLTVDDSAATWSFVAKPASSTAQIAITDDEAGPIAGVSFGPNTVSFNLDSIESLFDSYDGLSAYPSIRETGTFQVTITFNGQAPIAPVVVPNLTVVDVE